MTVYDEVPYPSPPRSVTHPARFAAPVALLGFPVPPFETARVLEVGCGEGGNLIAFAAAHPRAEFHGFDLAPTAIAVGQAEAAALGLTNVKLWADDVTKAQPEGRFDYVIVHGLYAWAPEPVREGIMALIARALSDDGLAFVSYNALPGCHVREMIRDSLKAFLPLEAEDAAAQVAALPGAVTALSAAWADGNSAHVAAREELERLVGRRPEEFFHDELADVYAPQRIADVAAHAGRHGLMYLCDGQGGMLKPLFQPSAAQRSRLEQAGGDWVRYEQLDDVVSLRRFRQSVFRRAGATPRRETWREALAGLHAMGEFELESVDSDGVHTFKSALKETFRTNDSALIGLLERLTDAFPSTLALADLVDAPGLLERLISLYTSTLIGLQTVPAPFTLTPGDRPVASPLARRQAAAGQTEVASLRHLPIRLEDEAGRRFLTLLDGGRDRDDLARALAEWEPDRTPEGCHAQVTRALEGLARMGLLSA